MFHSPFRILPLVARHCKTPPERAYFMGDWKDMHFPEENHELIFPHSCFFVEFTCKHLMSKRFGVLYLVKSDLDIIVKFIDRKGRVGATIDVVDAVTAPNMSGNQSLAMACLCSLNDKLRALYHPRDFADHTDHTDHTDRVEVYERQGYTIRYARVSPQTLKRDRDEYIERERQRLLIRKRDHAVRGHWRHYKNGRVIWVRSHRRGDPELGTVETHYILAHEAHEARE